MLQLGDVDESYENFIFDVIKDSIENPKNA